MRMRAGRGTKRPWRILFGCLAVAVLGASAAAAQEVPPTLTESPMAAPVRAPKVETAVEALAQDAAEYARQNAVTLEEAMQRLRAQEESVPATDRIAAQYGARLAGITLEHNPVFRFVVLLTGTDPVPDQTIVAAGMPIPVAFRTGAAATRDQIVEAIRLHQAEIRARLPHAQGMGLDPRTGELVLLVRQSDAESFGIDSLHDSMAALTGVPVRIQLLERPDANLDIDGGARLEGVDPRDGRRYACTAGFVVTDSARTGIITAAHCPDTLTYLDPEGGEVPLDFVGEWGARYQDVQVNVSPRAQRPLFYVDSGKTEVRTLTSWRNRASTRAGDAVCKRGETTGYSCSQVELIDYAPPGDLCGGPCDPTWVTVAGPHCRGGDSGGPIFNGTIAFGIVKGGSYAKDGTCSFYYYMSTDYLPPGWSLLHAASG